VPTSTPSSSPKAGRSVQTFAVIGDWGAGTRAQASIARRLCLERARTPFRYVITTGDNFYGPDGFATSSNYYRPEHCLISYPGHTWRAAWGNHDLSGDSTRRVLGARLRYYAWRDGRIEFFMLDGNRPSDIVQRRWLRRRLEDSTAAVKIAVFHQPPYAASLHADDEAIKRNWVPLFERNHVALVLNGHDHAYEHLRIRGIHYVITGGGGAQLYPCIEDQAGLMRCDVVYHFLLLQVQGRVVSVRAIKADGSTLDSFSITA
jgi:tartrate-resistant acid phosphatase type 5